MMAWERERSVEVGLHTSPRSTTWTTKGRKPRSNTAQPEKNTDRVKTTRMQAPTAARDREQLGEGKVHEEWLLGLVRRGVVWQVEGDGLPCPHALMAALLAAGGSEGGRLARGALHALRARLVAVGAREAWPARRHALRGDVASLAAGAGAAVGAVRASRAALAGRVVVVGFRARPAPRASRRTAS